MIGTMNKRVIIQVNTPTRDTAGSEVESWSTAATVWAAIEPITGREYWAAKHLNADMNVKITIRSYSGLKTSHRIAYGSRYYDILSIQNIEERGCYMVLICKEVA